MDVKTINRLLAEGAIDREDMWPRIVEMESKAHNFRFEFGLDKLPTDPGLVIIRGPRQYGKSTWLDMNLRSSAAEFGKGSSYYLNGDEIGTTEAMSFWMSKEHEVDFVTPDLKFIEVKRGQANPLEFSWQFFTRLT